MTYTPADAHTLSVTERKSDTDPNAPAGDTAQRTTTTTR